jgi:hypothetical protein
MRAIRDTLAAAARFYVGEPRLAEWSEAAWALRGVDGVLTGLLEAWSQASPQPLVRLLEEVDALIGDTLISLLRQLRAGYAQRPVAFPQTVVLCGVRDLRGYRIHARSEPAPITGGSAFNIKDESLRLGDFGADETRALLLEHTQPSGAATASPCWTAPPITSSPRIWCRWPLPGLVVTRSMVARGAERQGHA